MGVIHVEGVILVSACHPFSHCCNEVFCLISSFLEVLMHGMHCCMTKATGNLFLGHHMFPWNEGTVRLRLSQPSDWCTECLQINDNNCSLTGTRISPCPGLIFPANPFVLKKQSSFPDHLLLWELSSIDICKCKDKSCTCLHMQKPMGNQQIDIGHESHWSETGDLAWESSPGPIQISYCLVRGSNPGPTKLKQSRKSRMMK